MSPHEVVTAIAGSGLSIYDRLDHAPELFLDIDVLEALLNETLTGLHVDVPIRTRAKLVKVAVCKAMGYPVPSSFRKTQPRFPGQDLDVYVQKANNLQVWNEEITPTRRYAIARVGDDGKISRVRVVTGQALAVLDTTGTLTRKYQAKRRAAKAGSALVVARDTDDFIRELDPQDSVAAQQLSAMSPTDHPRRGQVLTIGALYNVLVGLEGQTVVDPGAVQERLRGEGLHKLVCTTLGLGPYADRGRCPDIRAQALEVKLQTAGTIDLGPVTPDSTDVAEEIGETLRHCDVRYAVVYADAAGSGRLRIREVVVTTGQAFFSEFQRFEGRVTNAKLQMHLPKTFFT